MDQENEKKNEKKNMLKKLKKIDVDKLNKKLKEKKRNIERDL